MLMQFKGFVRLLSAAEENALTEPAENCKFSSTVQKVLHSQLQLHKYTATGQCASLDGIYSGDTGLHWQ
jgi:hypothetical protein